MSDLTSLSADNINFAIVLIFCIALLLAMAEEFLDLKKSKPVVLAAGMIWVLIFLAAANENTLPQAEVALRANLLQYAELMLFLIVIMTYINALDERHAFKALRCRLTNRALTYRQLFWIYGGMAFFLSPVIGNLPTALLLGAIAVHTFMQNRKTIGLVCINIVVAANAGGVFSPFGDITSLLVWQQHIQTPQGILGFSNFLQLFGPALLSYLLPAWLLSRGIADERISPQPGSEQMRRGVPMILLLFFATLVITVIMRDLLYLPAVIGMMTGLSFLQFFGYYLKKTHAQYMDDSGNEERMGGPVPLESKKPFDIFHRIAASEWDTLFFLYGVAMCVGGLAHAGLLGQLADLVYGNLSATLANISIGAMSPFIENTPAIMMVLAMNPELSMQQWLFLTYLTGTGGSVLAIGSAAGVSLMGQAKPHYTFFVHLTWAPVIILGIAAGGLFHLLL
ncbi:MAG: sodium:proton antiporter NhaD [Chromatiales bacterium]|jgi:Na+/H+ antiporter NhaD/arsenite permease-like protein